MCVSLGEQRLTRCGPAGGVRNLYRGRPKCKFLPIPTPSAKDRRLAFMIVEPTGLCVTVLGL